MLFDIFFSTKCFLYVGNECLDQIVRIHRLNSGIVDLVWHNVLFLLSSNESNVRKPTFKQVRPRKTQISMRLRAILSEFLLSVWRIVVSLVIKNPHREDSAKTARIFTGRTYPKVRLPMMRLKYLFIYPVSYNIILKSYKSVHIIFSLNIGTP